MKWSWRISLLLAGLLLLAATGLAEEGRPASPAPAISPGERVVQISTKFLGTPYATNTLGGGAGVPEQLVMRVDAVDCFTLLDYIEALRRAASPEEFRQRLTEVRYRDGMVEWSHRRHFFTDWAVAGEGRIADVTAAVGSGLARKVEKELNRGATGQPLLEGVDIQRRIVTYLPSAVLDSAILSRLRPGDYLGIYSPEPGLDVSHVGLLVEHDGKLWLRHASSRPGVDRVIDSDLLDYLSGRPGLVVLRPQ